MTSTSDKTARKLDANRRAGRLCNGPSRSRTGCTARATVGVEQDVWTHAVDTGTAERMTLTMCTRHAAVLPEAGTNFRVIARTELA